MAIDVAALFAVGVKCPAGEVGVQMIGNSVSIQVGLVVRLFAAVLMMMPRRNAKKKTVRIMKTRHKTKQKQQKKKEVTLTWA